MSGENTLIVRVPALPGPLVRDPHSGTPSRTAVPLEIIIFAASRVRGSKAARSSLVRTRGAVRLSPAVQNDRGVLMSCEASEPIMTHSPFFQHVQRQYPDLSTSQEYDSWGPLPEIDRFFQGSRNQLTVRFELS